MKVLRFDRSGDYYECTGEDALVVSSILDLHPVTQTDPPYTHAGVPVFEAPRAFAMLVAEGYAVEVRD